MMPVDPVDGVRKSRYVLLTHDWPHRHWDLMLEQEEDLKTWRLESEPVLNQWITATPLPPHRLAYLDYEGPVSGGRGAVTRFDYGDYVIVREFPREQWLRLSGQFGARQLRILVEREGVRALLTAASSGKSPENH